MVNDTPLREEIDRARHYGGVSSDTCTAASWATRWRCFDRCSSVKLRQEGEGSLQSDVDDYNHA